METLKKLWRKKILVLFLIALAILLPQASVKPAQMLSKTLLVSIGIDKTEDGQYELSGAKIVTKFTGNTESSTQVISEQGNNVTQAINKMSASQGRKVSLAHCNLIVLGSGLSDENISSVIGTFLRKFEMSNNALLVWTQDDPKKLQETSSKNITSASGGQLETVTAYNQEEVLGQMTTIEEFYKNYLRPSSTSIIGTVSLKDDELANKRDLAVFKKGVSVLTLNNDETEALSMLEGRNTRKSLVLNNIALAPQGKARQTNSKTTAELQLLEKHSCIKTQFRGDIPYVVITSSPKVQVTDIVEQGAPERYIDLEDSAPLGDIKSALDTFIGTNLKSTLLRAKSHRADLLRVYDKFYREHNQQLKSYLKTKTPDDFLGDIVFEVEVNSTVVV